MAVVKIKNPVEYSFYQWINAYPESYHPLDMARFYRFVKAVCRHNATRWKDPNFFKNKIVSVKSSIDNDFIGNILTIYSELLTFYNTPPLIEIDITDEKTKDGYYLERGVRNVKMYEIEKPFSNKCKIALKS